MTNLLWILVFGNLGYLLFALSKVKKKKSQSMEVPSVADETRILNIPDQVLQAEPVGKTVSLKESPEVKESDNPWEQKIVRPDHHRMGMRKNWDHNQLLLKDIDNNLSN